MSDIILAVEQFLIDRRNEFIEKEVIKEIRDKKQKYDKLIKSLKDKELSSEKITQEKRKLEDATLKAEIKAKPVAEEKYEVNKWFKKAAEKAKPNILTHPAKFTNPKIDTASSIIYYGEQQNDGYVRTGNVNLSVQVDVSGNAATNTIIFELYSLLGIKLCNAKKIINHFEGDSESLVNFISDIGIEYKSFKNICLNVYYGINLEHSTHELVKQVYFPVNKNDSSYHLLSIVTASMLMFDVKSRIDSLNKYPDGSSIRSLKKENKFHPDGFDQILGLTEIGFSHNEFTKMGNVSYLNVKNKGIAYLLPSYPPSFQPRQIRLPHQNFFKNSLNSRRFKDDFEPLDKLIRTGLNNVHIREGIRNCLKYLIDKVLQQAFAVRAFGIGWSRTEHYQNLPLSQRIWLDDAYLEQRQLQEDWLEEIVRAFANWILDSYELLFKRSCKQLSDYELREVKRYVELAVSDDQEFFK